MNVLVTGGTGFVGRNLTRELAERGHDVTALARTPGEVDLHPEVETVVGDVTAYDSIEPAFEGQDAVVNLVALSPLFKPKGGDEQHMTVHLGGTRNCLQAAEAHGVDRFVQMSALGADPDGPTHYIRAKGQAEEAVTDADVDWTIFRPSVVFGDGDEFVGFTKLLAPPYFTPLPGGGKTRFQPIWIGDLVRMLAMALEGEVPEAEDEDDDGPTPAIRRVDDGADAGDEPNPHVGRTYAIGGPEVLTLAEVAELAHAADNKPVSVVNVPMGLAGIGLKTLGALPGAPMGGDQYRSLKFDNTTADNDVGVFGYDEADLRTLADYLGVDLDAI
ncbi:complex I NDUFA9 subunit family protein [Haloglomus litoreum]|uniref:complex I NDUFA9 subunit family protein n=1 Tax=Haloglomus litoreum TaxID=3034026 RepID=UPI0023E8BDDD|nr:complex I NDUFA9 subunit family protein [Haloglomus sp. DT116]